MISRPSCARSSSTDAAADTLYDDARGAEGLAHGEDEVRAESQKPVLVRDHEASDVTRADSRDQPAQALRAVVPS